MRSRFKVLNKKMLQKGAECEEPIALLAKAVDEHDDAFAE